MTKKKKNKNKISHDLEDRLMRAELHEISLERKKNKQIVQRKGWRGFIA